MVIKYIGHSCFKIRDEETGYSIIFDPYKPGSVPGYGDLKDTASEVLCTHDHDDHHGDECVILEPKDESPYEVTWIDTFHDPKKGKLRGTNRIYIVTHKASGEKLIHYGDVGEKIDDLLTAENLELLKDADVALVPVGGFFTIDRKEALDLIERTSPKLAVPMHFRDAKFHFGYKVIGSVEKFMAEAGSRGHRVGVSQMWFIDTAKLDADADIVILRPQNI